MTHTDTLLFGKFRGLKVVDVYQGKLSLSKEVLAPYLEYMLNSSSDIDEYLGIMGNSMFLVIDNCKVTSELILVTPQDLTGDNSSRLHLGNLEGLFEH